MRPKAAPEAYRLMLPSKYQVSAGPDFPCFLVLQRHGKSLKSGTFGARGPDFLDFSQIQERGCLQNSSWMVPSSIFFHVFAAVSHV